MMCESEFLYALLLGLAGGWLVTMLVVTLSGINRLEDD